MTGSGRPPLLWPAGARIEGDGLLPGAVGESVSRRLGAA